MDGQMDVKLAEDNFRSTLLIFSSHKGQQSQRTAVKESCFIVDCLFLPYVIGRGARGLAH